MKYKELVTFLINVMCMVLMKMLFERCLMRVDEDVLLRLLISQKLTLPINDCTDPDTASDGSNCRALISWDLISPYCKKQNKKIILNKCYCEKKNCKIMMLFSFGTSVKDKQDELRPSLNKQSDSICAKIFN